MICYAIFQKVGNYMDLFEEWLNKEDESNWVKRALTDSSYRKFALSLSI